MSSEFIIDSNTDVLSDKDGLRELEARINNIENQLNIIVKRKVNGKEKVINKPKHE